MPARPNLPPNRLLGAELRDLRVGAGLSQHGLAAELRCSQSKIARVEHAELGVHPDDLTDWLNAVEATPNQRLKVRSLARQEEDVSLVRLNAAAQAAMKAMVGDAPGHRVDAVASAAVLAYHQTLQQAHQDQAAGEAATIRPAPGPGGRRA